MPARWLLLVCAVIVPVACQGQGLPLSLGDRPIWVEADYLGWYIKGNDLPPLVTTSPNGTPRDEAGVLGQDTSILYGGEKIDDGSRSGIRVGGGMWLDRYQDDAIEISYLTLFDDSNRFAASTTPPLGVGTGLPILARPFYNVESDEEDAQLISYPSVVDGSVIVRSSSELHSAEILYRDGRSCGRRSRYDLLCGYRYFQFDENLFIAEDLVDTELGGLLVDGTRIEVYDSFAARNSFHGGTLGLSAEYWSDYVSLELRAKVALGGLTKKTRIKGQTRTTVPGGGSSTASGGLLALPTNIGTYRDSVFAALPEFGADLKFQLTECAQMTFGYTLLMLHDVARTGAAIDRSVNPGYIPGGLVVDPSQRPAFRGNSNDFWVQGFNVGLIITR